MEDQSIIAVIIGTAGAGFRLSLALNVLNRVTTDALLEIAHVSKTITSFSSMLSQTATHLQAAQSTRSYEAVQAVGQIANEGAQILNDIDTVLGKCRQTTDEWTMTPSAERRLKRYLRKEHTTYQMAQLGNLELSLTLMVKTLKLGHLMTVRSKAESQDQADLTSTLIARTREEAQAIVAMTQVQNQLVIKLFQDCECCKWQPSKTPSQLLTDGPGSLPSVSPNNNSSMGSDGLPQWSLIETEQMLDHMLHSDPEVFLTSHELIDPCIAKWTILNNSDGDYDVELSCDEDLMIDDAVNGPVNSSDSFDNKIATPSHVNPLFQSLVTTYPLGEDDLLVSTSNRARFRAGRLSSHSFPKTLIMPNGIYEPYARVSHPTVCRVLLNVAEHFNFLDYGFAEFFRSVAPSCNAGLISELLKKARQAIEVKQNPEQVYLGELGEFCERFWNSFMEQTDAAAGYLEPFKSARQGDQSVEYLQDALEVPYWNSMIDLFFESGVHSPREKPSQSIDILLRLVKSYKVDIEMQINFVRERFPNQTPECVLEGIKLRMEVLQRVLTWTNCSGLSAEDTMLQITLLQGRPPQIERMESPVETRQPDTEPTELEKVSLLTLLFIFLAMAIVPGTVGFAKSINVQPPQNAIGSSSNADFWWLIQSTIMTVLGNLLSAVPLLKLTRTSMAYNIMWLFLLLSLSFGISSIAVYPHKNTAWSSLLSFFCNFFAVGALLVLTQQTRKDSDSEHQPKKAKTE